MPRLPRFVSLMVFVIAFGCDRDAPAPVATESAPVRRTLEIHPIAPLLPARRTHLAVDGRGNIFWSQEMADGDDVVFSVGDDGVPRATRLTSAAVLAQTREAAGALARGNIQSLAFGPDGALYFYITGGTDRRTIAALGRYIPTTSLIQVLASTRQLMTAADMGSALALARGTVVASGGRIVFWLRHTDASIMFEIDPRQAASASAERGAIELKPAPPVVAESGPLRLTRENQFLAPGEGGSLLLLDIASAELLSITPEGKAAVLRELSGLPQALSLPAVDARGRVLLFAGNAPRIDPRTEEQAGLSMIEFPALLTFTSGSIDVWSRRDIAAHPGFPLAGMKLQQLVCDRASDACVAYDESSGELLRLHVRGGSGTTHQHR